MIGIKKKIQRTSIKKKLKKPAVQKGEKDPKKKQITAMGWLLTR